MKHEELEHGGLRRDELDELDKLDELDARGGRLDDAVTEPDLSAIPPTDDTGSLGRTSVASDHWTPPLGGWLAPLSIDVAALSDAPHDALYDATSDVAPMSWPASPGWPPSPTLANQPTRRMRRRRADADRPLFFALGALLGAVLVSGAALLAIVYIASHPGLFTLASQRPPDIAPTATVHATPTATRTPTPSPTIPAVGANPAPIIVPQSTPTARPTPQATTTPTPAPTATATPAATASPTPTAEPVPSTTPTATPAPTPTLSPAPAATATPTATSP